MYAIYLDVSLTAEPYPAHVLAPILHNLCGPSYATMHRGHHIIGHTAGCLPHADTE